MAPIATPPVVLTVAGFDPSAGAGILADIKAIAANQAYGIGCVAAQTVQNTKGVRSYLPVDATLLDEQLRALLEDMQPRAAKVGMLGGKAVVETLARRLERSGIPAIVVDPVRAASDGTRLADDATWKHMRERLLPLATVVTPNLAEAAALAGIPVAKPADMQEAAVRILALGPRAVLVKGGHLEDRPVDLLYDGATFTQLPGDRVRTPNTHGTGCTFSAALAANLALGKQLLDAAVVAKAYVSAALRQSYATGAGPGPLNHLYRLQESPASRNVDPAPQHEFTTR